MLYNIRAIMNTIREANVCLRWLILHRKSTSDKIAAIVTEACSSVDLLKLMLVCSDF